MKKTYQITTYIPKTQCEEVKEAMFKAGARQIFGEGQFKPIEGSNSFLGERDKLWGYRVN